MAARRKASRARRVVVLMLPGAFSLDVLGAFEIFELAARLLAMRELGASIDPSDAAMFEQEALAYDVELAGVQAGPVETASGARLVATRSLASVRAPIDTFIVAGGTVRLMMQAASDPVLVGELRRVAKLAKRVASVCTGAFLLAAAGLLDEKRATTHWAACDALQQGFPRVHVERYPVYAQDGHIYTSAGASTGVDLSLALVREDHGRALALEVARWLVLYVQRPAGQSQLSIPLRTQEAESDPLRDVQTFVREHPDADLSVVALAARAGMSVRNFARAFRREVAMTPAAYVQAVRVEVARRKLELGRASVEEVARDVGFGSVATLRRAFARQVGQPPAAYREHLTASPASAVQPARLSQLAEPSKAKGRLRSVR
jgi:transcriptional regulator GlxA family with amidase domain